MEVTVKTVFDIENNGIIVYGPDGEKLFPANEAMKLVSFLVGLQEECPKAEIKVSPDYANSGKTYELGKEAGRKLRENFARYIISYNTDGMILSSGIPTYNSLEAAIKAAESKISKNPEIENCIVIDKKDKVIYAVKEPIDLFKKQLDMFFPGWKVGKIER